MAASLNDQAILAADALFIGRVQQALVYTCTLVREETVPLPPVGVPAAVISTFFRKRSDFATAVLSNPAAYKMVVAAIAATDATVIANATQAGTVALTTGNVDAQQALASDTNINNAVYAQFNTLFSPV